MNERPRVGEILVSAGIIDEMQLNAALGEQARWGRRIGVTLIKMGMVEEGHLIRALAKQLDLPVASLAGKRIPERVIALVPARVASEHGVIPLFTKKGDQISQLFLGMEDPSNLAVLDDLSFRTGMEIHPVMVGPSELSQAIDRYYHARRGGVEATDPARKGDTIGVGSLRIVTDDTAHPGTAPASGAALSRSSRSTPHPGQPTAETPAGPPPTLAETLSPGPSLLEKNPPVAEAEIELSDPVLKPPPGLLEDVAKAIDETERTRVVAKAITQLLIQKGVLSLEEMQAQIAEVKAKSESEIETSDAADQTT